jgi:hypothetical protein
MLPTTPPQLILKLSWDNERLACYIFMLRQSKKLAEEKFR